MPERFIVATLAVGLAYLFLLLLQPVFQQYNARYLLMIGAVVFSAWYGGPYTGLIAATLTTIVNYFILPTPEAPSNELERWLVLALYALVAMAVSWLEVLRQHTAEALQRERELLQKIFDLSPIMIALYEPDTKVTRLNRQFENLTGWTTEEASKIDFMAHTYPDPAYREEVRKYMESVQEGWRDLVMTTKDGSKLESSWSNVRLRDDTQVGIGIDIRERKRAEVRIRLLQELTAEFSKAIRLVQVADVVMNKAVPASSGSVGYVYLLDDDGDTLELLSSYRVPETVQERFSRISIQQTWPLPTSVRTGEPIWLENTDEIAAYYPEEEQSVAVVFGVQAAVVLPLRVRERVIGGLSIAFPQTHHFAPDERQFFIALADHCAQAMERARLYESEHAARQEMEKTANRINRLLMVTAALAEALTVDQVVRVIVDQGATVLGAAAGTFQLLVENGTMVETRYTYGGRLDEAEQEKWQRYPANLSLPITTILRSKQALWFHSAAEVIRDYPLLSKYAQLYPGASVIVPVLIGGEVIGTVNFSFDESREFSDDEKAFVTALTQQCAGALERVRLSERAQEAAANEERQRLARDLHDAVSQTLFAATTIAESIPRTWERNPANAQSQLSKLVLLNRAAMAEMRNLLLELRPEALVKSSLSVLLKHLADAAKGRKNIEVDLAVEVDDDAIPPDVHVAFYRIAQESINNILKHSQASRFTAYLRQEESRVQMLIADDGQGFDLSQSTAGLGLQNMRERANAIGATFDVASGINRGTRITVTWQNGGARSSAGNGTG